MPWMETEPMNEKVKFIAAYLDNSEETFVALCTRFNISCKTGYKYVNRYKNEGIKGLDERPRIPHTQPNRMSLDIENSIREVKRHYPTWGAKKIHHWLTQEYASCVWPAKSTIGDFLKRHKLVRPAKRKRRVMPYQEPLRLCTQPNDNWSIDYKGQFRLGNQAMCYPLTVTDNFSRFVFAIDGEYGISGAHAKRVLMRLFAEFGLPSVIRSDNGSPFASHGLSGLSSLAVWLIKLGILPERIRKGHPEENGRHERMHATLKRETASPPQWDLAKQQRCFDHFKRVFNQERPHEGIGFNRPQWLYTPSERRLPKKLEQVEYDRRFLDTRRIRTNGTMKWAGKEIFVSETLVGETIGMKPQNEHEWLIYFSFFPLAIFNEKTLQVTRL